MVDFYPMEDDMTDAEHKAMVLYHLGGIEAGRGDGYNVHPRTVQSLMRKGFFTTHDITAKGRQYIAEHVVPELDKEM